MKYGHRQSLQDYQVGRDRASLVSFATGLKPSCSFKSPTHCNEGQRDLMKQLEALSQGEVKAYLRNVKEHQEEAETTFKQKVMKLQSQYDLLVKEKSIEILKYNEVDTALYQERLESMKKTEL